MSGVGAARGQDLQANHGRQNALAARHAPSRCRVTQLPTSGSLGSRPGAGRKGENTQRRVFNALILAAPQRPCQPVPTDVFRNGVHVPSGASACRPAVNEVVRLEPRERHGRFWAGGESPNRAVSARKRGRLIGSRRGRARPSLGSAQALLESGHPVRATIARCRRRVRGTRYGP